MLFCLLCHSRNISFQFSQTENVPWAQYGYEKGDAPSHLKFYKCYDCDLIFKDPLIRASAEKEKQHYVKHHNEADNKEYQNYMKLMIDPFLKYLKKGDLGLDFGSGPNPVMAQMFEKVGFKCLSFDPLFQLEEKALDKKYEFITCSEAAEHFNDPHQEFNLLFSLLKPNGKMAVRTKFAPPEGFDDWWYQRDPTHVVFYSQKCFQYLTVKFGKKVVFLEGDISIFY